jgi:hypothetical protein
METADEPQPSVDPNEPRWMRLSRPYFDDPALRPVLFALMGHVVVVIVPLMLAAYRTQNVPAIGGLIMLTVGSVMIAKTERQLGGRLGAFTLVMLLTWSVSVALTWVCYQTNVL